MPTEILYSVSDRVATVTLNRPDKLNAWTRNMEAEVRQAMQQAAADDNVRVIVLTGARRGVERRRHQRRCARRFPAPVFVLPGDPQTRDRGPQRTHGRARTRDRHV